jgi:hypothetical protein
MIAVHIFLAVSALFSMLWARPTPNVSGWVGTVSWISYAAIVLFVFTLFGLSVGLFDRLL